MGNKVKFSIRRVNGLDEPTRVVLTDIHKKCFPGSPMPAFVGGWWLAFCGEDIAGFAGIHPSSQWSNCGYMVRAGVLPPYRGYGLQKRLIKVRLAYAKRQGWDWVITETHDNPPSASSLIYAGFKPYTPSAPWGFKHDTTYWRRKVT